MRRWAQWIMGVHLSESVRTHAHTHMCVSPTYTTHPPPSTPQPLRRRHSLSAFQTPTWTSRRSCYSRQRLCASPTRLMTTSPWPTQGMQLVTRSRCPILYNGTYLLHLLLSRCHLLHLLLSRCHLLHLLLRRCGVLPRTLDHVYCLYIDIE